MRLNFNNDNYPVQDDPTKVVDEFLTEHMPPNTILIRDADKWQMVHGEKLGISAPDALFGDDTCVSKLILELKGEIEKAKVVKSDNK